MELKEELTTEFIDRIDENLSLALKKLGMELAIVSQINNNQYRVLLAVGPCDLGIHAKQVFNLGRTFCSKTWAQEEVIAVEHVKESTFSSHPCYLDSKLEAYAGVKFYIHGKPFGTINFSSRKPRKKFTDEELFYIKTVGAWISDQIETCV